MLTSSRQLAQARARRSARRPLVLAVEGESGRYRGNGRVQAFLRDITVE